MSLNMIIDFSTIVFMGLFIIAARRILRGLKDHRQPQVVDLKRVHIEKGDILIFETQEPISEHVMETIKTDAFQVLQSMGWSKRDVQVIVLNGSHLNINKVLGKQN